METKRKATYTVEIPIRFTYTANNEMGDKEFLESVEKEVYKRLENGYFDVFIDKAEVVSKLTHRTREEIIAEKKKWDEFFESITTVQPEKQNIFFGFIKRG